jgi:hypothetical protein
MSAFQRITDSSRTSRHVGFVPRTEVPSLTATWRRPNDLCGLHTKKAEVLSISQKGRHCADRVRRDHVEPIDCPLKRGRFEAKRHCGAEQVARRQDRSHESQLPDLNAEVEKQQRHWDQGVYQIGEV